MSDDGSADGTEGNTTDSGGDQLPGPGTLFLGFAVASLAGLATLTAVATLTTVTTLTAVATLAAVVVVAVVALLLLLLLWGRRHTTLAAAIVRTTCTAVELTRSTPRRRRGVRSLARGRSGRRSVRTLGRVVADHSRRVPLRAAGGLLNVVPAVLVLVPPAEREKEKRSAIISLESDRGAQHQVPRKQLLRVHYIARLRGEYASGFCLGYFLDVLSVPARGHRRRSSVRSGRTLRGRVLLLRLVLLLLLGRVLLLLLLLWLIAGSGVICNVMIHCSQHTLAHYKSTR